MFLLRIIVLIVIILIALPYIKKGADAVMRQVPGVSKVVNEVTDKVKSATKQ
jgi:hypothetical protein